VPPTGPGPLPRTTWRAPDMAPHASAVGLKAIPGGTGSAAKRWTMGVGVYIHARPFGETGNPQKKSADG
jgi:hypothetical protein